MDGRRDPYLESLANDPHLGRLFGRRARARIIWIAIVWSLIAISLALTYVVLMALT